MNNKQVSHNWAHGRKGSAGHFTTNGIDLYSYAMRIGTRGMVANREVFFCSTEKRSVTTSAHQSLMRRAIPHGAVVVNSLSQNPLPDLLDAAMAAADVLDRKRIGTCVHARAQEDLTRALDQVEQWCSLIGEPMPDLASLRAQALAKAEEAKALRDASDKRRRIDQEAALARWLTGQPAEGALPPGTWLRVLGDVVQTSGGLKFPLQACKDKLAEGVEVGDDVFGYRCLEVTKTKYVVGCHVMDRKHVEALLG